MSNTLSLATRLRSLSDDELADVMSARGIAATGIKDFFDLAEAFLAAASVQQMLTRLERETLAVLAAIGRLTDDAAASASGGASAATGSAGSAGSAAATAGASGPASAGSAAATGSGPASAGSATSTAGGSGSTAPGPTAADVAALLTTLGHAPRTAASVADRAVTAAALLLVEPQPDHLVLYDSVRDQLRSWPAFGFPTLEQLAGEQPPPALEPVPDIDRRFVDRLAAERAFAATTATAQLLTELEREPARELSKGGIALPDTKRLANAMAIDLETVPAFLAAADRAGLVARESGLWMITDLGGSWLLETSGRRWGILASAWYDALPADIRGLLGERVHAAWGTGLRGFIHWLYPAGGEWMGERFAAYTRDAELLGITANQVPSGPGALLLEGTNAGSVEAAQKAMAPLLPPEVEQVYLQHDLSIVAPGPLTPRIDARLRSLADVESRALASSYRVSTSSVNRAMASGETAESMLAFLASISLTGIPQPLGYLVTEASKRYGTIRAGELSGDDAVPDGLEFAARSYLRTDDSGLLSAIMVDQNLSVLALIRISNDRAVSRYPLDTLFWSLSDARYPVAAENAKGEIVSLRRRRTAHSTPVDSVDAVAALIERLRLGGEPEGDETGQAWLLRQLDVAIRARSALTVSVTMPNGSVVDYQLEPTSVGGGRLRARDRKSAIERTLPLGSIAAISAAE